MIWCRFLGSVELIKDAMFWINKGTAWACRGPGVMKLGEIDKTDDPRKIMEWED